MFCCLEVYVNAATADIYCRLCHNVTSTTNRKTHSMHRLGDDQVCPRCRHRLSDAATVNELGHHRQCMSADNEVTVSHDSFQLCFQCLFISEAELF